VKQYEFNPSAEGAYRDAMLEQYRECRQERPQSEAQKKASKAGKAPDKTPARKPERKEPAARQEKRTQQKCTPKKAAVTSTSPAFSEEIYREELPTLSDDPYGDSRLGRWDKAIKKLVIDIDLEKDKEVKKDLEQKLQKLRENRMKVIEKEGVEG